MYEIVIGLAYWVHNINPFLIHFSNNRILPGIRWYGVLYLLGFFIAYKILRLYSHKNKVFLDQEKCKILLNILIIGVLFGGRIGYILFYDLQNFIFNPLIIFMIWNGGMSSHGGFIGVFFSILWFSYYYKTSPCIIGDICASLAAPGLFLGRIANFINGSLWGKVAYVPWAIIFPQSFSRNIYYSHMLPRHPSQLYQAFLEGVILFLYTQYRFWHYPNRPIGQLGGEFLLMYSILRIFGELYREPDASLILGVNRGIFYSIFLCVIGFLLIVYARLFNISSKNVSLKNTF